MSKKDLLSTMDESQLNVTRLLESTVSDIINDRATSERMNEIDDAIDELDRMINKAILDRTGWSSLNKLKNQLLFLKIDLLLLINNRK